MVSRCMGPQGNGPDSIVKPQYQQQIEDIIAEAEGKVSSRRGECVGNVWSVLGAFSLSFCAWLSQLTTLFATHSLS